MRKVLFTFCVGILFLSIHSGCGSDDLDAFPNVAGNYTLTNTNCPGSFDSKITVVQDKDKIIIQSANPGFFDDAQGTVDEDGQFKISSSGDTCSGQFISGVATANCDGCQVTYKK